MKFGTKLAFIFILIGFLPLLLGGFFLFYFFDSYLKETTYKNLGNVAEFAVLEIENSIDRAVFNTAILSENPILKSDNYSLEEKKEEIGRAQNHYQLLFENIFILSNEGDVVVSTRKEERDWRDNEWLLQAREEGETVISDIYDPEGKRALLEIFVPIKDEEGGVSSFVVTQVNSKTFFKEHLERVGEVGEMLVLNREGEIIFHEEKENLFKKISEDYPLRHNSLTRRGYIDFEFEKKDLIASFRVIGEEDLDLDWHLVVGQTREDAFGFVGRMITSYLLLIIIFLVPIIFVSFFISRKMIKPLKDISVAAKRVAKGDLNVKAEVSSSDEFGDLAENFNKMTGDLEKAKRTMEEEKDILEVKVNARTRELNELNENLEKEIQKRTEEMKKKLNDFEKMSKLMVGRELEMVKMKKEMQALREENEELKKENKE